MEIDPTDETKALIFKSESNCFATAQATTQLAVSLAEERPPPL